MCTDSKVPIPRHVPPPDVQPICHSSPTGGDGEILLSSAACHATSNSQAACTRRDSGAGRFGLWLCGCHGCRACPILSSLGRRANIDEAPHPEPHPLQAIHFLLSSPDLPEQLTINPVSLILQAMHIQQLKIALHGKLRFSLKIEARLTMEAWHFSPVLKQPSDVPPS